MGDDGEEEDSDDTTSTSFAKNEDDDGERHPGGDAFSKVGPQRMNATQVGTSKDTTFSVLSNAGAAARIASREPSGAVSESSEDKDDRTGPSQANSSPPKKNKTLRRRFVTELNPRDVVLGRGSGANELPGNCAFRTEVTRLSRAFVSGTSDRNHKLRTLHEAIRTVTNNGGRFVRKVPYSDAIRAGFAGDRADSVYTVVGEEDAVVCEGENDDEDAPIVHRKPAESNPIIIEKTRQTFRYVLQRQEHQQEQELEQLAWQSNQQQHAFPPTVTPTAPSHVSNTPQNNLLMLSSLATATATAPGAADAPATAGERTQQQKQQHLVKRHKSNNEQPFAPTQQAPQSTDQDGKKDRTNPPGVLRERASSSLSSLSSSTVPLDVQTAALEPVNAAPQVQTQPSVSQPPPMSIQQLFQSFQQATAAGGVSVPSPQALPTTATATTTNTTTTNQPPPNPAATPAVANPAPPQAAPHMNILPQPVPGAAMNNPAYTAAMYQMLMTGSQIPFFPLAPLPMHFYYAQLLAMQQQQLIQNQMQMQTQAQNQIQSQANTPQAPQLPVVAQAPPTQESPVKRDAPPPHQTIPFQSPAPQQQQTPAKQQPQIPATQQQQQLVPPSPAAASLTQQQQQLATLSAAATTQSALQPKPIISPAKQPQHLPPDLWAALLAMNGQSAPAPTQAPVPVTVSPAKSPTGERTSYQGQSSSSSKPASSSSVQDLWVSFQRATQAHQSPPGGT